MSTSLLLWLHSELEQTNEFLSDLQTQIYKNYHCNRAIASNQDRKEKKINEANFQKRQSEE